MFIYSVLNKWLHALGVYSTHLNEQEVPVDVRPWVSACWDVGEFSRSSPTEKSGKTSRNQCKKNCNCWRYRFYPRLEKSPRTVTLPMPHPASAAPNSSWPSCRVAFCWWLLVKCLVNTLFVANILSADEAGFTRKDIVNVHNTRVWVCVNPHATMTWWRQHRFLFSVLLSIFGDQLLEPVVLANRLNRCSVSSFLVNNILVLLENAPLHQRQHMWFMYDGAPSHFLHIVTQRPKQNFGEQWMGRRGPVNGLAWSPEFNPLGFSCGDT
jgi:hypothetical protein